jgi:hypothetical protein
MVQRYILCRDPCNLFGPRTSVVNLSSGDIHFGFDFDLEDCSSNFYFCGFLLFRIQQHQNSESENSCIELKSVTICECDETVFAGLSAGESHWLVGGRHSVASDLCGAVVDRDVSV